MMSNPPFRDVPNAQPDKPKKICGCLPIPWFRKKVPQNGSAAEMTAAVTHQKPVEPNSTNLPAQTSQKGLINKGEHLEGSFPKLPFPQEAHNDATPAESAVPVRSVTPPEQQPSMSPRMKAIEKFKAAAIRLRKTMPAATENIPPLVDFRYQPDDDNIDIATAAINIGLAMEEFMASRKESEERRSNASKFVQKWFETTFPFIKVTAQLVEVPAFLHNIC
jgi:hypothetical protein